MTKRLAIFLIPISLVVFALTIFLCWKKFIAPQEQVQDKITEIEIIENDILEIPKSPMPIETFTDGVVLYDNASLWLFGRDEKMHSFSKIPANTVVAVVSYDDKQDTKIAVTEKSETENPYLHVIYNSVDFWILESLVAPASTPAVIIERVVLYENATMDREFGRDENSTLNREFSGDKNSSSNREFGGDAISPTSMILKFGTAIALGSETRIFDDRTFEKIYYFDKDLDCVLSGYIEAGKASTKYDDIVVADIVEKLKVTTRATPRNELFLKAEKYNPSAAVKSELENQKVEKISYDYNEVLESMSKTSRYRVNLDELNTVDQSKDPFQ